MSLAGEGAEPPKAENAFFRKLHRVEDTINASFLFAMMALGIFGIIARVLRLPIPGPVQYVGVLTMWVGFGGAMLAARDRRHLSMSTGIELLEGKSAEVAKSFATLVAAVVTGALAFGAFRLVQEEMTSTEVLPGGFPAWPAKLAMPIGYAAVMVRLVLSRGRKAWLQAAILFVALGLLVLAHQSGEEIAESVYIPALAIILVSTLLGAPVYVALGGLAVVYFWSEDTQVAAVAADTLRQIKNPIMPTIPLFTFTGYLLAESNASRRLVRVFRSSVGWLPGGMAIMTATVCAFFTTFTGASGVTIVALGALLYPMLRADEYPDGFSVGLLTASGSIGLLFPPALPVILYAVFAHVPVDQMFVAGFIPGLVLVAAVSLLGVRAGLTKGVQRPKFDIKELVAAVKDAKWELFIPLVVIGSYVSGLTGLVESAAVSVLYVLFIETVIYKDISFKKDFVRIGRDCATLVGGVLIILGVALGFTNALNDAEVTAHALEWIQANIESKYVFLIALNILLLIVGCLMDIFSALVVVVPVVLPMANHFGIDPIHLGVIFLANLELGFLTPPVGMNLFLSAYRFNKPLTKVYAYALPFLLILLIAVLLITYVPALSLAPVEWIFGDRIAAPPIDL